jgi:epoxyqueuosine reductase
MDYLPKATAATEILQNPTLGYVARYALGRDYHKILRNRLQSLATKVQEQIGAFGYRVFTDSGPVLEKALARNAGLGWIGKHTNLINRHTGSFFLLGEILTDLPLPPDLGACRNHCGSCSACIDVCPTQAILGPYQLDARRCISYLTIELKDSIPESMRDAIGNRIFGCDDCQLVCPWNRYAQLTHEADFQPRHDLDEAPLLSLARWTKDEFDLRTRGTALRRMSFSMWQRNIAVALGNAPYSKDTIAVLQKQNWYQDDMVLEHVEWALNKQQSKCKEDEQA